MVAMARGYLPIVTTIGGRVDLPQIRASRLRALFQRTSPALGECPGCGGDIRKPSVGANLSDLDGESLIVHKERLRYERAWVFLPMIFPGCESMPNPCRIRKIPVA